MAGVVVDLDPFGVQEQDGVQVTIQAPPQESNGNGGKFVYYYYSIFSLIHLLIHG